MPESLHILIVDDHPQNLLTLEQLLESPDLNIVRASSGQEALRLTLDYDFALVLLDVQMPEMDGFETAELMRSNKRTRNIPIIFVTANHTAQSHIFRGYETGAVDYLFKPLEPQMLLSKVHVFLELQRQRLELQAKTHVLDSKIAELETLKAELESKNRELQLLSTLDGLTGIPNRRHFDETLEQEWQRMLREKLPLSLIMIDVDHFKRYNDHYGHMSGDRCLRRIAAALAALLKRPADVVARYGGEEFTAMLPGTYIEGAEHVAEAMRKAIASLNIEHLNSPAGSIVTISLGVCTLTPVADLSPSVLLQAADQGLYRAKLQGRNQWVTYQTQPNPAEFPTPS